MCRCTSGAGAAHVLSEWDWLAAERSFQRALAINPNHAEAYLHYGDLMEALGELDRGLQLKLRGLECDQTSALAHVAVAVSFWNQRRYDDVIVWVNKTLDRDPEHLFARGLLVGAYRKKGDFERQLTEDLRRGEAPAPNEEVRVVLETWLPKSWTSTVTQVRRSAALHLQASAANTRVDA